MPCLAGAAVRAQTAEPLVSIDVGHTLAAPGATSARGVPEYRFNRALADEVLARAPAAGLRTVDDNPAGDVGRLTDRTKVAEQAGAQFFLSLHHDSVQPQFLTTWTVAGRPERQSRGRHGFSLFVSRQNPDVADSLRCASAIGAALRAAGFAPSRYHAEPITGENRPFADETNGVHFYDGLAVLRTARSPATLLEAGVISDADEEARLARPATRDAIGGAIVAGLRGCLASTGSSAIGAKGSRPG